ncbi:hypothetical protein SeLEV6574_g02472 [Synchytrium endobioticum]|uniref:Uncharacterized protein n=1 Tax=Synchytrium endobioticum TaxID=286115 RepID=A0A507D8B5_9FUNG|nr:hypothetical protein SeLEV6574_g02472 [Synchytrium endobioticum]
MSPFFTNTGKDANMGTIDSDSPKVEYDLPVAKRIKDRFRAVSDQLQAHLQQAQRWYKEYADKQRLDAKGFDVDDEVLISTKNVRTQRASKVGDGVDRTTSGSAKVFHVKLLKPYTRSTKLVDWEGYTEGE